MRTPHLIIILPLTLLLVAYLRARFSYSRDPTSFFFDRNTAYDRIYSKTRQGEAKSFIETSASKPFQRSPSANRPLMCIGIPTVARPGGYIYVRETIGSLLAGLDQSERDAIHLMPFIGHSEPTLHPIHNESWLHNVADQVLTYNTLDAMPHVDLKHIEELENDKDNREKQIFDYAYMLQACLLVGAKYVVTFEDDVLALDGWFHRTGEALAEVKKQVAGLKLAGFFYLRLFYTEQYLGWNAEDWYYYLAYSILVTSAALMAVLVYLRKMENKGSKRSTHQFLMGTIIFCAIGIGFFFASGRVTMLPQAYGVQQMPKNACCAQGLVYNPVWIPRLIDWYHEQRLGFVDEACERLAETGEVGTRWALTPSVVQHVGSYSTKGEDDEAEARGEISISKQRWNFAFEMNDPEMLRTEHEAAVKAAKRRARYLEMSKMPMHP